MKRFYLFMIPVMMLAACQPKEAKVPAIDLADLDTSVAAGEDFYQYANGGWMKNDELHKLTENEKKLLILSMTPLTLSLRLFIGLMNLSRMPFAAAVTLPHIAEPRPLTMASPMRPMASAMRICSKRGLSEPNIT